MKTFNKSFSITLLALPGIVLIFIFNYVPLYGLLLPFKNYRFDLGIWNSPWVGLDNFKFLFNGNSIQRALRNTLLYNLVFISLGTFISVVLALMLREIARNL